MNTHPGLQRDNEDFAVRTLGISTPLKQWTDFTFEKLTQDHRNILYTPVAQPSIIPDAYEELADVEIRTETDLNHYISWNDKILKRTLNLSSADHGLSGEMTLGSSYSPVDGHFSATIPFSKYPVTAEHVLWLNEDDQWVSNMVVGMTKRFDAVKYQDLLTQPVDPEHTAVQTLSHLAIRCKAACTRYGYLQTEAETVICRFSFSNNGTDVEIMPISWEIHGGLGVMSTNVALWWLCMMAAKDTAKSKSGVRSTSRSALSADRLI
ncbi:hypothetical protein S40293_10930 [Stachybotrys chartarum IBT 40293]|nr:hypothetical protein S40293_10930 [Stachybotrys chartarum IBT 40293]